MILLFWFSITQQSESSSKQLVPPKRAIFLVSALAIYTVFLRILEHSFHFETFSIWQPDRKLTLLLNIAWIATALITLLYLIYRAGKVLLKEHKLESENVACAHVVNALVFTAIFLFFAFRQSLIYDFNEKLPVF